MRFEEDDREIVFILVEMGQWGGEYGNGNLQAVYYIICSL